MKSVYHALSLVMLGVVVGGLGAPLQSQSPAPPPRPKADTVAKAQPASPPAATPTGPDAFRIGPEDVLDISVWKSAELTRTVAVRPDGRISLPLLNDIQAANLTPMQLRDALAVGYGEFVSSPEVSVIVREIHSVKVSVVGTVKTPGRYELRSHATVLEALALAGGLTDFAKRDRIVVFRPRNNSWTKLPFNYARVLSDWDTRENFDLEPGDIVVVP
jgi:polysaccharide export outer membrane protein